MYKHSQHNEFAVMEEGYTGYSSNLGEEMTIETSRSGRASWRKSWLCWISEGLMGGVT